MASKNNKRSVSALDPLMAGFAGGAAAFIVFAMPQARFDDAIALSGLPMILEAAQPPLGATARGAVMIAAGVACFLLVWFVLRALGSPKSKTKRSSGPVEIEMAPPRLRRADMHPDAPSRRPILAGVDLGRSFDDVPGEEETPADISASEQEPFDNQDDEVADPYGEQAIEELPAFHAVPEQDEAPEISSEDDEVYSEDEEEEGEEPTFAEVPEQDLPVAEDVSIEPEVEAPAQEEQRQEIPLTFASRESQAAPVDNQREASIGELMQRLEAGLSRRRPSRWAVHTNEPVRGNGHAAPAEGSHVDARLRGAIEELQKLAARSN